jgi:Do/DeqQ family serine protease
MLRNSIIAGAMVFSGLLAGVLLTARLDWTTPTIASNAAGQVNAQWDESAARNGYITENGESPFVAVADRVGPTVVNITSDRIITRSRGMNDFFDKSPFWDFFHPDIDQPDQGGERERKREWHSPATGSGMIISRDGYILTNNHVVEDAETVTVKTLNGDEYEAEIIGKDPESDIAVIKVNHTFAPSEVALIGNSDAIRIGDWAIAMGNPLGLEWTLTVGVISAMGRSNLSIAGGGPSYQDFIQTDASINFGNSGGPLCNIHGEVIAVNTAINPSGQGIGFAIPINMAMKIVKQLRESGIVARGYLGMLPRELTTELRSAVGLSASDDGVFVERVDPKTPAEQGGLEAGDVIVKFGDTKVNGVKGFRMAVADYPPGSSVDADILRNGEQKRLNFVLGNRSELASLFGQEPEPEVPSGRWLGIEVGEINEAMARALKLDGTYGVIINNIEDESPADEKLREGDVIIEIDRQPVDDVNDFKKVAAGKRNSSKALLFRIVRNGTKTFEAIEP